jgi:hypothetical protein
MKKLVILAMIGMISTFTSCVNSNDELSNKYETEITSINSLASKDNINLSEKEKEALALVNAVKSNDEISDIAINTVNTRAEAVQSKTDGSTIMCHGNYSDSVSWAYVQVSLGGQIFHRLVRSYRMPGGGRLTQAFRIDSIYDCNSTLFM